MKAKIVAAFSLAALSLTSAYAALPSAVTTTIESIKTDGQGIFDAIFPVIGTLLGLSIVIKLFKRFIKSA